MKRRVLSIAALATLSAFLFWAEPERVVISGDDAVALVLPGVAKPPAMTFTSTTGSSWIGTTGTTTPIICTTGTTTAAVATYVPASESTGATR